MTKCFECKKNCPEQTMILLNQDGDFVCGKRCQTIYEERKKDFFDNVIHDAKKTEDWLLGKR